MIQASGISFLLRRSPGAGFHGIPDDLDRPLNALTEMTLVVVARGEDNSTQHPARPRQRVLLRCPKCWAPWRKARHHRPKGEGSVKGLVLQ